MLGKCWCANIPAPRSSHLGPTSQELLAGELPRKIPSPGQPRIPAMGLLQEVGHWIGRVVQLQNFTVLVYLGNGTLAAVLSLGISMEG